MLAVGLSLRIPTTTDYGLPFVYYADEGSHFTNRAVAMFGGDPNPATSRTRPRSRTSCTSRCASLRPRLAVRRLPDDVIDAYAREPPASTIAARWPRSLAVAGVVGIYFVGRRAVGPAQGLVAAAVLASRSCPSVLAIAVTDVGTLLPVALALLFAVRIHEPAGCAGTRPPARPPGWRSASSTRPGWCCCRRCGAGAGLARPT